jgi:hypothetical protein
MKVKPVNQNNINTDFVHNNEVYAKLVQKIMIQNSYDLYVSTNYEQEEENGPRFADFYSLLLQHVLISTSNFTSSMLEHLKWLKGNIEVGREIDASTMLAETKGMIESIERFLSEKYPPKYYQDIKEFYDKIMIMQQEQLEEQRRSNG